MTQIQTREKCPICNGEGTLETTKINACTNCKGDGYVYEWVDIKEIFNPKELPANIRVIEHMSYFTVEKLGMGGWMEAGTINK